MAAVEGKHASKWGDGMLPSERERKKVSTFVKLGLYYLEFGKDQALLQINQSTT